MDLRYEQGEFILTQKLNHIDSLQIVLYYLSPNEI